MFSLQWRKYGRQFDVKSLCKLFFLIFKNNVYCALVLWLNRKSSAKVHARARPTPGSSSISWFCSPVTGRWTVVCVRVVAQVPDQTCEVKKQLNHRFTTVPMFHLCSWTSGSDRKDEDFDKAAEMSVEGVARPRHREALSNSLLPSLVKEKNVLRI